MRYEHKFTPNLAKFARNVIAQVEECRRQYLIALGQAKEAETRGDALRAALSQHMALVEESEGLPRPLSPYQLSPDASGMWADVIDPAPAPAAKPVRVNGAAAKVVEVEADAG